MSKPNFKLTDQQKTQYLIGLLERTAHNLFEEGHPVDKEIYGWLFKLQSLDKGPEAA
jgi:hypothetical protein